MKDFIIAALPWMCFGVVLAIYAVNFKERKKGKREHDNYMTKGMCFGLLLGSQYLSYGLLIGMVIGLYI